MTRIPSGIRGSIAGGGEEITLLLARSSAGDLDAEDQLLRVIYEDLRRIARRAVRRGPGNAWTQSTAVVHDVYLELLRGDPRAWPNRRYFFAAFARAVHEHLIDLSRRREVREHAQALMTRELSGTGAFRIDELEDLRAHLAQLDAVNGRSAEIFRNHFLLGMKIPEIADALGIGHATVERDLRAARTWLHGRMRPA